MASLLGISRFFQPLFLFSKIYNNVRRFLKSITFFKKYWLMKSGNWPPCFYRKIDSNAHFIFFFPNTGWLNRETTNTVRFSIMKIRISINFVHLRSKLTAEICSKVGSVDRKTEQNSLKVKLFATFFHKKYCIF